jgi:hypothetical protein
MKQSFLKIIRWDKFKMYCNSTICRSCTIETCPRWEDLKNFYTKEMRDEYKKNKSIETELVARQFAIPLANPISRELHGRTFRTEAFEEKH